MQQAQQIQMQVFRDLSMVAYLRLFFCHRILAAKKDFLAEVVRRRLCYLGYNESELPHVGSYI